MSKNSLELILGVIVGILVPVLIASISYMFYYKNYEDLQGYSDFVMPKLLALCGISNIAVFYFCMNYLKKMQLAKGIVVASVVYAVLIFIYKLVS